MIDARWGYGFSNLTLTNDSISVWPLLWPLRQILPQFGQILFPFRSFAALAPLRVDALNRRVQRELRRFQVAACSRRRLAR